MTKKNKIIVSSILFLTILLSACNIENKEPITSEEAIATQAVYDALMGAEGEYAAYALYGAVIDKYGQVEPYVTIQKSEAKHIDALKNLLDKYNISYPDTNPYLATAIAPDNLKQAALSWVDGEIANIEMYDELLAKTTNYPDISRVFNNLRRASQEKHLPAFRAAAENGGTLSQEQMEQLFPRGRRN